ncbi:MAG: hypothetical protein U9P61_01395 [Patescibacteria group bacterium]|nr:hypothetical protein [Patescibacteria group bacterium]
MNRTWQKYNSALTFCEIEKNKENVLQEKCNAFYLSPTKEKLGAKKEKINSILGRSALIIPMKEEEPVIAPLLDSVVKQFKNQNITVINDRSSRKALLPLDNYKKINTVDCENVLEVLNQEKLLEILNTNHMPHGKGVAVLAGYLTQYIINRYEKNNPEWIIQHDAEVSNYTEHKGVDYLGFGISEAGENVHHIKTAKSGRNNECIMMSRSSLLSLKHLSSANPYTKKIKKRAEQLFLRLVSLKWMVSGAFALRYELAMNRPFATGYLEEVLTCAFVEDVGCEKKRKTIQVSNPNPCYEGNNNFHKEWIILQGVSNFLFLLAIIGKPINKWSAKDIRKINKKIMSDKKEMGIIPPEGDERPIQIKTVPDERIIPSIKDLDKEGVINWKKAEQFYKAKGRYRG